MFEIYSFCRLVDDIADSDAPHTERLDGLARWRLNIDALYFGRPPDDLRNLAERELPTLQDEQISLSLEDALGGVDLLAQRGFLDGSKREIRGECQIGGFQLIALHLLDRFQILDGPSHTAEHIRRVGQRQLLGMQRVVFAGRTGRVGGTGS